MTGMEKGMGCGDGSLMMEMMWIVLPSPSPWWISFRIDCSPSNRGCDGGDVRLAFGDLISSNGLCSCDEYPYVAQTNPECLSSKCSPKAAIVSFKSITPKDETALKAAVAQQPVAVLVSSGDFINSYTGGVFAATCATGPLDRALLLVGYDTDTSGQVCRRWCLSLDESWQKHRLTLCVCVCRNTGLHRIRREPIGEKMGISDFFETTQWAILANVASHYRRQFLKWHNPISPIYVYHTHTQT